MREAAWYGCCYINGEDGATFQEEETAMGTRPVAFLALLPIVVAAALVLGPAGRPAAQEGSEESAQQRQAELPKPLVIPPDERKRTNPVPRVEEAIEAGRSLYNTQCAMCHGPKGKGRGDLAKSLKFKMPDLSDPAMQKKRTDGDLFYIIGKGHGQMPAETRLPPPNRWEMVHYIRTLGGSGTK